MTNQNGSRELAYVVEVDDIRPIPGKDRVECAVIGGWTCMVSKGVFKPGDLGVYFEIDSHVDTTKPEFAFVEKYHGNIKTQRFKNPDGSYFYSQGLLMSFADLGTENCPKDTGLTEKLGVTYYVAMDNVRKSSGLNKYKAMSNRHTKLFKFKFVRWMFSKKWGKKVLFFFLGNKKDKRQEFPYWVVKTDEERIQNLTHLIPEFAKEPFIATEKVDGTSSTMTLKKGKFGKFKYVVCSRNVVINTDNNNSSNAYCEISNRYKVEEVLKSLFKFYNTEKSLDFITLQGEIYGEGVQKRTYGKKEIDFAAFNLIFGYKDGTRERKNPYAMEAILEEYNIPTVPILGKVDIPETCEEILAMAHGASKIDSDLREGIVFRSLDATKSFKAVDNEYLIKYHG